MRRLARKVDREITGSILDRGVLERVLAEFRVELVFHLAALLSTRAEFTPVTAHQVNVEGTLNLLEFAQHEAESHGRPVVFMYPSSIAAYGLPNRETKAAAGKVKEDEWTHPTTMYGCNKLYCEQIGRYYARYYKQLAAETASGRVDFRSVRFPGLISALTMPSGGTSDYAPEMIHAAAKGETVRVLRPAGYADPVHGDARRRRRAGHARVRAARRAHAHRVQRRRFQSVGRRDSSGRAAAHFRPRESTGMSTTSGRASSIHGPPMWTTRPRAATGASRRATISSARSTNTWCRRSGSDTRESRIPDPGSRTTDPGSRR